MSMRVSCPLGSVTSTGAVRFVNASLYSVLAIVGCPLLAASMIVCCSLAS